MDTFLLDDIGPSHVIRSISRGLRGIAAENPLSFDCTCSCFIMSALAT